MNISVPSRSAAGNVTVNVPVAVVPLPDMEIAPTAPTTSTAAALPGKMLSSTDPGPIAGPVTVKDVAPLPAAGVTLRLFSRASADSGGFKVFSNQGSATRKGIELSAKTDLSHGFGSYIAYNYIDATYDKSGKNIAGIPHDNMFGELSWKYAPVGFKVSTEMIYNGKVYATTDNTVSTDSYAIFNLKASLKQKVKGLSVTEYLAVNNIGDRVYVEAVNVDGAYSRYFATGPARNVMVGVSASYAF